MPTVLPASTALPAFIPVDLDKVEATSLLRDLAQHPAGAPLQFLVDCRPLACVRQLGVSHVVSQLLLLHRSGARVFLCNVDPLLHRCLRLLRLDALFPVL